MEDNFFASLWAHHKRKHAYVAPREVYEKLGMYRQQFFQYLKGKGRNHRPEMWAKWRAALNLNRKEFWDKAMNYYDPE